MRGKSGKLPLSALLLSLAFLLVAPVQGAVRTMDEIDKLPEKEDEAELWETARSHEERLVRIGTLVSHPDIERNLDSLADRMLGDFLDHLGIKLRFVVVEEPTLNAWAC